MSRAVAVDLGERRIGVAVSDGAGTMAFPRPMIERRGDRAAEHRAIAEVVAESEAGVVVVGLPLSLDGRMGPAAKGARAEADELAVALAARPDTAGARVETFDERLTTVSATAALAQAGKRGTARRRSVDSAAAAVLLQAWLDGR
ncbi:MAG TPA: Holliday junction resolvase RuvX [Acidimicrobiales bacterium]|nr:Holliday junction resolvase RuvX [Acidimicrobiales bacterium]